MKRTRGVWCCAIAVMAAALFGDVAIASREHSRDHVIVFWLLGTARELPEAKLDAKRRAQMHLARAQEIFDRCYCGIHFRAELREADITAAPDLFYATCDSIGRLKARAGWSPAALNVYYVADGDGRHRGMKGLSCGTQFLLITRAADRETLAHEIGHASGLWHLDTDPANLMASIGYSRSSLTPEQCVRVKQAGRAKIRLRSPSSAPALFAPDCRRRNQVVSDRLCW